MPPKGTKKEKKRKKEKNKKKEKTKRRDKKKFKKFKKYDAMINDLNDYDILLNKQLNNLENSEKIKLLTTEEIAKRKLKVKDDMENNYNNKQRWIRKRDNILKQITEGKSRRRTPSDESDLPESATVNDLHESATVKQPSDYGTAIDRFTQEVKEFTQELETEVVPSQQQPSEDTGETRSFSDKKWSDDTAISCPNIPETDTNVQREIQSIVDIEIKNIGDTDRRQQALTQLINLLTVCGKAMKVSVSICGSVAKGLYSVFQAVHSAPIPGANILAYLLIILFACSPPAQIVGRNMIVPIFRMLIRLCGLFSDTSIASIINAYFIQPGKVNLGNAAAWAGEIVGNIWTKITESGIYIEAAEWLKTYLINLFTAVFNTKEFKDAATAAAGAAATAAAATAATGVGAAAGTAAAGGAAATLGDIFVRTLTQSFPTIASAAINHALGGGVGPSLLTLGAGRKYTRKLKRKNRTKRRAL